MRMRTENRAGMGRLAALVAIALMAAIAAGMGVREVRAAGCQYSFSSSSYNVTEGDAAQVIINQTSGSCAESAIVVQGGGADTATIGTDYENVSFYTVTFPDNDGTPNSKILSISTVEDGDNEPNETFDLLLQAPSGSSVSGISGTVVTIVDDDGPSTYSFQSSSVSFAEGVGNVTVTVLRGGAVAGTASVECSVTGGSATGGGDDYLLTDDTANFANLSNTATCGFRIDPDAISEPGGETITVGFANPVNFGGGGVAPQTLTITITDDDGSGVIQFSSTQYTVNESDGTASISVTRTGGSNGAASAFCRTTAGGSASLGNDYSDTDDQVSWGDGQSGTRTCTVPILDDALLEGQEYVLLVLDTFSGASAGSPTNATLFINDDEGTGTLAFSATSYAGTENGGAITITVVRTGGSQGTVTVDVATTTSGSTATINTDYSPVDTTLTFTAGDTVETFTVSPVDDAIAEGVEHVNVVLSNATGGAIIGSPSTAAVNISDNESPNPVITSLSPSAGTILGGTTVTITGVNFTNVQSVTFGGFSCTTVNVVNSTTITCLTPAHLGGVVDVVVTTLSGSSTTAGEANDYTYTGGPTITALNPATGQATGNTVVTITGTNFTASGMVVKFDTTVAVFSFIDTTTIIAVSPPHSAGTVDVSVTTPGGTSPNTAADDFIYTGLAGPNVTLLSPASGPVGTTVIIAGSGFTGATLVTFGGIAATYTVNSDGQITASVPSGTPGGTVDVRVTTSSGTSPNTAADNFNNTSASPTVSYTLFFRFTLIVWTGPNGISALAALRGQENPDNPATNNVSTLVGAVWRFDAATQTFKGYFPGSDGVPGANDFTTLSNGVGYFIALLNPGTVTWTTLGAN